MSPKVYFAGLVCAFLVGSVCAIGDLFTHADMAGELRLERMLKFSRTK